MPSSPKAGPSAAKKADPYVEEITGKYLPKALQEGWNTIHGKEWDRSKRLGTGSYGHVHLGKRVEDGMVFAVKSTSLVRSKDPFGDGDDPVDILCNEMYFLDLCRCKYVIQMLGCGRSSGMNTHRAKHPNTAWAAESQANGSLDLFLEYIPRGTLDHLMARKTPLQYTGKSGAPQHDELPENYIRAYAADILMAVDHLHKKQCVHGDIKPLNILVGDDCLKLADFGGAKSTKHRQSRFFQIRTRAYEAPEVFEAKEQGFPSDIFSFGCVVLEMANGSMPKNVFIPTWISGDGQSFLRRCLARDPKKRWTAAQLLEHPFIRDRDLNDTEPYSTKIPDTAEKLILRPPPFISDDEILSPTYVGPKSPCYQKKPREPTFDLHRGENITVSDPPNLVSAVNPDGYTQADGTRVSPGHHPASSAEHERKRPPPLQIPGSGTNATSAGKAASSSDESSAYESADMGSSPGAYQSAHSQFSGGDSKHSSREAQEEDPHDQPSRSAQHQGHHRGGPKRREGKPKDDEAKALKKIFSGLSKEEQKMLVDDIIPAIEQYNDGIKFEAWQAERAGLYDNKLCPPPPGGITYTEWAQAKAAATSKRKLGNSFSSSSIGSSPAHAICKPQVSDPAPSGWKCCGSLLGCKPKHQRPL